MKAWVGSCPIHATLDSGCTQSLVRADFIPPLMNHKASLVRMACLHGEAEHAECQWVQPWVMEYPGDLLVRVVPQLACDMLLG